MYLQTICYLHVSGLICTCKSVFVKTIVVAALKLLMIIIVKFYSTIKTCSFVQKDKLIYLFIHIFLIVGAFSFMVLGFCLNLNHKALLIKICFCY